MIHALCAIVLIQRLCFFQNLLEQSSPWYLAAWIPAFKLPFEQSKWLVWADCSVVERPVLSHPHLLMTLTVITSALVPTFTRFDCKSRWSCFLSFAQSILELIGVNGRVRNSFWNSSVSMTICKNPYSANGLWPRESQTRKFTRLWPEQLVFIRAARWRV